MQEIKKNQRKMNKKKVSNNRKTSENHLLVIKENKI